MTNTIKRAERRSKGPANKERLLADHLVDRRIRAGAQSYDRERDLPALIRLEPFAPAGDTREAVEAILSRLERALRAERNRARSGHWTYDLNRHIALRQAHRAETERLAGMKAGRN